MKKPVTIFILFFFCWSAGAQKIQTIVPRQVVEGNAFQVQYIITEPEALVTISDPEFDNLRLISGPNYYKGSSLVNGKLQAIENVTYTFVPLKAGTIHLHGITAGFKNSDEEKTEDVSITVVAQPKASFNAQSTYTDVNLYAPSSKADFDKLIEENLFIKTEVDKRSCYLGEAVTATFKLYSRLQSISEVINAPSLYGFSVMDMLDINEAHQAVETINGKIFNTSILRKLQLYPAQTGSLVIDEMQLQNEIEFGDPVKGGKIKVEKLLSSKPVEISVKPLPSQQPPDFTGAVGIFSISAQFQNSKIVANQQGKLVVTISGKGNFIQFAPPAINWPKGFDVFDPAVSDELDKNSVPAEGKRNYVYSFTTGRAGSFIMAPVSFSFFDPASRNYKKLSSDSLKLTVANAVKREHGFEQKTAGRPQGKSWLWVLPVLLLLILVIVVYTRKKRSNKTTEPNQGPDYSARLHSIIASGLAEKQVCLELQKLLNEISRSLDLTEDQKQEAQSIISDCQLLVYTGTATGSTRKELLKRTEDFLRTAGS